MDKLAKVSALYALISSLAIAVIWVLFLSTGYFQLFHPDLDWSKLFLLFAEFITSALLLVAGIGLLKGAKWAEKLFLASAGMLLYALIYGTGEFIRSGILILSILFPVVMLATLCLLFLNIFHRAREK